MPPLALVSFTEEEQVGVLLPGLYLGQRSETVPDQDTYHTALRLIVISQISFGNLVTK